MRLQFLKCFRSERRACLLQKRRKKHWRNAWVVKNDSHLLRSKDRWPNLIGLSRIYWSEKLAKKIKESRSRSQCSCSWLYINWLTHLRTLMCDSRCSHWYLSLSFYNFITLVIIIRDNPIIYNLFYHRQITNHLTSPFKKRILNSMCSRKTLLLYQLNSFICECFCHHQRAELAEERQKKAEEAKAKRQEQALKRRLVLYVWCIGFGYERCLRNGLQIGYMYINNRANMDM